MNPWEIIKKIFAGEMIDTDVDGFPVLLINRMLSFDKEFLAYDCQYLNHFYPLRLKEWYYLFLVCFSGRGRRINYIKKEKSTVSKLIDEFQKRTKQYYKWSTREFLLGYKLLTKHKRFPSFLEELGFSDADRRKIMEYFNE